MDLEYSPLELYTRKRHHHWFINFILKSFAQIHSGRKPANPKWKYLTAKFQPWEDNAELSGTEFYEDLSKEYFKYDSSRPVLFLKRGSHTDDTRCTSAFAASCKLSTRREIMVTEILNNIHSSVNPTTRSRKMRSTYADANQARLPAVIICRWNRICAAQCQSEDEYITDNSGGGAALYITVPIRNQPVQAGQKFQTLANCSFEMDQAFEGGAGEDGSLLSGCKVVWKAMSGPMTWRGPTTANPRVETAAIANELKTRRLNPYIAQTRSASVPDENPIDLILAK
ncbi:hypothetical protein C8R43DRAFT_959714 [Mycena crocata]|nr:hypothetical protein C8R43DRAFT_959714 [Mycena crocata]